MLISALLDESCLAGVMGLLAELYGSGSVGCDRGDGGAYSEPCQSWLRATHKVVGIFMRTTVEKLLQASLYMLYAVMAPSSVEGLSGHSQSTQGSCFNTTYKHTHPPHTGTLAHTWSLQDTTLCCCCRWCVLSPPHSAAIYLSSNKSFCKKLLALIPSTSKPKARVSTCHAHTIPPGVHSCCRCVNGRLWLSAGSGTDQPSPCLQDLSLQATHCLLVCSALVHHHHQSQQQFKVIPLPFPFSELMKKDCSSCNSTTAQHPHTANDLSSGCPT